MVPREKTNMVVRVVEVRAGITTSLHKGRMPNGETRDCSRMQQRQSSNGEESSGRGKESHSGE